MYDPTYNDDNSVVFISIKNNDNNDNDWYYIYADTQALTSDSVHVPVPVSLEDLVFNSHNLVLNDKQPYDESSPYLCVPSPSFFSDCIATDTTNLQSESELGSPFCYGVFSYEGGPLSEKCESKKDKDNVLLPKKSIINSKRQESSSNSIYEHGIESPKNTKKPKNIKKIINAKQCKKKKCEHGPNKYRCRICGGSSICVHGNERYRCKQCGGSSICVHGILRPGCKECKGSSICEHNKQRARCRECGGASICVHDKQRSRCKQCGGSYICVHKRRRTTCKEC